MDYTSLITIALTGLIFPVVFKVFSNNKKERIEYLNSLADLEKKTQPDVFVATTNTNPSVTEHTKKVRKMVEGEIDAESDNRSSSSRLFGFAICSFIGLGVSLVVQPIQSLILSGEKSDNFFAGDDFAAGASMTVLVLGIVIGLFSMRSKGTT